MNKFRFDFSIGRSTASAALVSVALLTTSCAVSPVAAESNNGGGGGVGPPDNCQIAHSVCYKSCVNELEWCYRDCDYKFIICKPSRQAATAGQHASPTAGIKNVKKPFAGGPQSPRAPLGDGILVGGPGMGPNGPAAVGAPVSGNSGPSASAPIR